MKGPSQKQTATDHSFWWSAGSWFYKPFSSRFIFLLSPPPPPFLGGFVKYLENIILCTFLLHSEFGKTCLYKTQYKITWNRMSALSTHVWDFYSFLGWQWSRLCPFSGPTPGEVEEYWKWRTCILISQTNKNIKNILVTMELYLCQFCWHWVWLEDGLYFNLSKSQEYQKGQAFSQ